MTTTMFLLLMAVTLGVANAGNLLYEAQQQPEQQPEQQPPSEGLLCPDQASRCPETATCCQLSTGQWGCCPFVRAICCGDNVHCCPDGYSCNSDKGECARAINNDTIPWAKKVSASSSTDETAVSPSNALTCPDRTSVCSGSAACCRTLTGNYRCCNYPNNVCCSNGYSCCPRCTVCDQLKNKCISGYETKKWEAMTASSPASLPSESTEAAEKLPANVVVGGEIGEEKSTTPQSPVNVIWCDRTHYCGNGQTCCRQSNYSWGCCPYFRATCCPGSNYCCPLRKRCSFPPGRCF